MLSRSTGHRLTCKLFPPQALSTALWSGRGRLSVLRRRRWASSTWRWKRLWWAKTTRSWRTGRKTRTTNRWSAASKKQKKLRTASVKLRSRGPKNSKRFVIKSYWRVAPADSLLYKESPEWKRQQKKTLRHDCQFYPSVHMVRDYWLSIVFLPWRP